METGLEGFEPPTSGFGNRRSTSWSYRPKVIYFISFSLYVVYEPGKYGRTSLVPASPVSSYFYWYGNTCYRTLYIQEKSILSF